MTSPVPPTTPILVGVGQASERLGDPDFTGLSPVDLSAHAARAALHDTGVDAATIAAAIDTIVGVRQFEHSTPRAHAPLGTSNNVPRSVAARLGVQPEHAVLEVVGGQGPQHLVNEFARRIADGDNEVVLLTGSEAISSVRHFAKADQRPDFSETVEGTLEDRGYGLTGLTSSQQLSHGLMGAPSQYALFENARRARLKESRADYAASMGKLFEPFTAVAANNPHSSAPRTMTAEELVTVTERNRWIAEPYPRFLVARDQVNQGAAVLLTSVAAARRLGIAEDRWVFLHGHADLRERDLLDRADLSRAPSAVMAAEHALEVAGITVDDVATFDLYSCFPIAVSNVADGLGLAADDPRGLTVTGGLPFFGGAGNNYSMHAIAETVQRCRANPGSHGFVGANGGQLSKYSVGVYATTPTEYRRDRSAEIQAEIDAWPAVDNAAFPDGPATIETYTITHARDGRRKAIVVGRLEATDERFVANGLEDDDELVEFLATADEPIGQPIFVRAFGFGNRVTLTADRMRELRPVRAPGFRDSYEFVEVARDGHLLEVTINRPQARNALHPPAHEELEEIFDAYFADPDLWVAIITGAGDKAFCAGNDLIYTASGKQSYFPRSGFAGLTSRAGMTKPVIAAVNGYAMGGGLETAMACHLVVVDSEAKLALSEVRVGLVAAAGGVVRLPRQLPVKTATEMILTGRRLGAQEALERGLVNKVTPAGQALAGARELAAEIMAGSPTSVRVSLQLMNETEGIADTIAAVTHRSGALDELMIAEDTMEGLSAFGEKRPPQWKNR
ncbi:acetyl-CoA acetyltransferase [Williamsia sp. CHRR-6]|uniref:acetyl-CoA acetyltransferase n=1 Tax=Williamsia sp. CHRR-6 TaxID=2835871 RepID=UPI001BDA53EA|nr:acetyl-CoA acetyltransferase [Williamsia sp. CHRR-6]MBT0566417.1 enoyl-CoA hydratase/isomerase family protein [Williamsia sp. CHRR-6]